jgi:tetratricopeptide (TPR) repeat protein
MLQDSLLIKAFRIRVLAVSLALALTGPAAFAVTLDEARALAAQGKITQALGAVDDVLVKRPEDVSALLLRGVLLSRAGRSDDAIEVFNAIAGARPELPEPHNNLAVLYAAQGRYEEARGALVEAIRLQPDYALAHENLGDVYAKLAALSYSRATQIDPGDGSTADKSAAAESLIGAQETPAPPPVRAAAPATPAPTPVTSAQTGASGSSSCIRIKDVAPPSRADGVARWLRRHGMQADLVARDRPARSRSTYRVFIPSLGSKSNARKRITELRQSGISDLIMITDANERYGISLGVFARRESAERRVQQLKGNGIDSQIAELSRPGSTTSTVNARGEFAPSDFARAFPDLRPEIIDCR